MKKPVVSASLWWCLAFLLPGWGCSHREPTEALKGDSPAISAPQTRSLRTYAQRKPGTVVLEFRLKLNPGVYRQSDWGEPPQFAVWLEDETGSTIQTVFVTRRTGKGNWVGKVECPVALPYWSSRYNIESGTAGPPTGMNPVPDAITGATPKADEFAVFAQVPRGSKCNYYIEVNCSGDFNGVFPARDENGMPDPQGNGQPSLIYRGQIEAAPGSTSHPLLIGRTDQWQATEKIDPDLTGITTAKELFSDIQVFH